MARTRVVMHSRGARELLHSAEVTADLRRRGAAALAAAQASAPVESGAYRASLRLDTTPAPSRARVRVVSGVPYGMSVEAESGVLARALDAAGGDA